MGRDREQLAKSGETRACALDDWSIRQVLHLLQEAGQGKTRAETAAYITAQQRRATDFERHAWLLLAMWNETRSQELFYAMVLAHWADATRYLQDNPSPDDWASGCERDEHITRELLSWLGISLISCDATSIVYSFCS